MRTKRFAAVSIILVVSLLMVAFTSAAAADKNSESAPDKEREVTELCLSLSVKEVEEEAPCEEVALEKDDFAMANFAEDEADVFAEASEDAKVVGKIFSTTSVEVVERNEDWTHLKSGNVDGYIQSSKLMFGSEGRVLMAAKCQAKVVFEADTALYNDISGGSDHAETAAAGDAYLVKKQLSGWYVVESAKGEYYVPSEGIKTEIQTQQGKTVEEIAAEEAASRQNNAVAAAEGSSTQAENVTTQNSSSSAAQQTPQINAPVTCDPSELDIFAALLFCEAGTNYDGCCAVGAVVMNRVRSELFPNTLLEVINQPGQFTPAINGKVYRVLAAGVPDVCYQAAQAALGGYSNVGNCLFFRAGYGGVYDIGGNAFR